MGLPRSDSVGRYELLIELAKGGMAELFVGRLHGVGGFSKLVAIKRILPHLAVDKLFAEMFLNEGRIAARLSHTNICQVHELGEADGDLYLAMEYLEGVPWSELARLVPRDVSTLRLAAGVIAQACDGLHYAHELRDLEGNPTPVVHRDVSPQNLFVTVDGTCKVLDFGIAKMLKDGPRTRTGVLKGKLPYMSPEQIQGEEIDARSDVFALGVVLWEALTGKALFDRETDFLIWKAITEAPVPALAPFGYPASIDAVIGSALARDKAHRFRSARALGEALRTAADEVGGAYDAGEIAELVRRHCGARLAERQREVATAVARRSQPVIEPEASDTIEDKAGSTVDLPPVHTNAGSTVSLRSDARSVARRDPPRRSPTPFVIGGAIVVAAVIVAIALLRREEPPPVPAPVATAPEARSETRGDQIDQALDTLGQLGSGGKLDRAMKAVESLKQWGEQAEKMRETLHGEPEPRESGWASADEPEAPPPPTKKPARSTTKPATEARPAATGIGFLSIDSEPFATIYVDNTLIGPTPHAKVKIGAGTHTIKAVTADGRSRSFTVEIVDGKTHNAGRLTW